MQNRGVYVSSGESGLLQSWTKLVETNRFSAFFEFLDLQARKKYFIPLSPYSMLSHGVCGSPGFVCTTRQH